METLKYDLKVFVEDACDVDIETFIAVFHRWIQGHTLEEVLIDVADYRHVHHGPGVLLIAHDAHYAIDMAAGRMGLLYRRKRETQARHRAVQSVVERLASVFHDALTACQRLEAEATLQGRLRFRTNAVQLRLNDRLQAPNTSAAFAAFWDHLGPFLHHLYAGSRVEVEHLVDVRVPLTMTIQTSEAPDIQTLLKRLGTLPVTGGVAA